MSACSLKYCRRGSTVLAYRPSSGESAASGEGMPLLYRDEGLALGSEVLQGVREAPRAEAGVPLRRQGPPADRRPGAGAARARERHPLERRLGRRAARMARARSRHVLRHLAHRHRADLALLPGNAGQRRPAAAPGMRAALAAALPGGFAFRQSHLADPSLRAKLLSIFYKEAIPLRYRARLPSVPASLLSA